MYYYDSIYYVYESIDRKWHVMYYVVYERKEMKHWVLILQLQLQLTIWVGTNLFAPAFILILIPAIA